MKLGGINVIPDRRDVPFLTDPANPTIVMGTPLTIRLHWQLLILSSGGDMSHPPLGHDAGLGAIRHSLPLWEVSTALGRNTFQRWGYKILYRSSSRTWRTCAL